MQGITARPPPVRWTTSSSSESESSSDTSKDSLKKRRSFRKPNRLLIGFRNWFSVAWSIYHRHVLLAIIPQHCVHRHRRIVEGLAAVVCILLVAPFPYAILWTYNHSMCYAREATTHWNEGPAHTMRRECPLVDYPIMTNSNNNASNICITTLTDSRASSMFQKAFRCRNFDTVATLTWPNHQAYGERHGYRVMDQSHLLDTSRPPAWSKIRAVQSMLDSQHCDWVLWLDADTVIMDSSVRLETILPAVDSGIDLVVTTDRRFTANSGAWMIRNSAWGRQFLDDWWNMRGYVRPKGLSLSGDNDAFGALVRKRLGLRREATEDDTRQAARSSKIRIPARCTFNSFGVFTTASDTSAASIDLTNPPLWYLSDQFYHEGDFVAHASGIDQKAVGVELLLQRAK